MSFNFISNQISSLEGLGQLWTHLAPNLDALFLGNNDIITLQRSKTNTGNEIFRSIYVLYGSLTFHGLLCTDGRWDGSGHSLALLSNLNWLNVDGNIIAMIKQHSYDY